MRIVLWVAVLAVALSAGSAQASITLHVDAAPNVFGSPDWPAWWAQTKDDVSSGNFTNLRSATYPGTLTVDPYDMIVYSTGDLGQRLHFIYWIPDETISSLEGRFEVKTQVDWAGSDWTLVSGNWAVDEPEVGWSMPSNWEEHNGGVIGSIGFAWWPDGTQAAIDAMRDSVLQNQTYITGLVRIRDSEDDPWQFSSLTASVVPEPSTLVVWTVLISFGMVLRRRKFL